MDLRADFPSPPYDQLDLKIATAAEGDVAAMLDYRRQAPGAEHAHPTDEHWQPIYVAMGAAGEHFRATRIDAGIDMGFLAMDLYRFDDALPAQAAA